LHLFCNVCGMVTVKLKRHTYRQALRSVHTNEFRSPLSRADSLSHRNAHDAAGRNEPKARKYHDICAVSQSLLEDVFPSSPAPAASTCQAALTLYLAF